MGRMGLEPDKPVSTHISDATMTRNSYYSLGTLRDLVVLLGGFSNVSDGAADANPKSPAMDLFLLGTWDAEFRLGEVPGTLRLLFLPSSPKWLLDSDLDSDEVVVGGGLSTSSGRSELKIGMNLPRKLDLRLNPPPHSSEIAALIGREREKEMRTF